MQRCHGLIHPLAAQAAHQALALFAAGAGRVEFGTPHGLSEESGLRLLGEAVLPHLR